MTAVSTSRKARPPKTVEEKFAGVHRQLRALEEAAVLEDPWAAAELLEIAREAEAAAFRVIAKLRAAGYTWPDIGFSLGVSGDTAHKRYDRHARTVSERGSS